MFHLTKDHPEEGGFALIFFTQNEKYVTFFKFNVMLDVQLKLSSGVRADRPLLNDDLTSINISLYKGGRDLIRLTKKLLKFR